jgi:hypothetical protein
MLLLDAIICARQDQEDAMRLAKLVARTAIVWAGSVFFACSAHAIDLTGVWATNADACGKVFAKKGNKTSFRQDSDMYGSGFIIEGRRIRGRTANCTVTKTKEDDGVVHMIAACATDIMLSNVQFSVKMLDENKISRIFPGIEGMELMYYRCPAR